MAFAQNRKRLHLEAMLAHNDVWRGRTSPNLGASNCDTCNEALKTGRRWSVVRVKVLLIVLLSLLALGVLPLRA